MSQHATPETYALHLILQRVIVDAVGRNALNANASAIEAAQAFRAGLAAFTAPREACAKDALHAHQQRCNSMAAVAGVQNRDPVHRYSTGDTGSQSITASKLSAIESHTIAAAEASAKACSALAAFAALQRLADAAGKLPPSPPDAGETAK